MLAVLAIAFGAAAYQDQQQVILPVGPGNDIVKVYSGFPPLRQQVLYTLLQ